MRTLSPERLELAEEAMQLREFGWTQQQIANFLKVPQQTVSYWLANKQDINAPSYEKGRAIALHHSGWEDEAIAVELNKSLSIIKRWVKNIPVKPWLGIIEKTSFEEYLQCGYPTLANVGNNDTFTNNSKRAIPTKQSGLQREVKP